MNTLHQKNLDQTIHPWFLPFLQPVNPPVDIARCAETMLTHFADLKTVDQFPEAFRAWTQLRGWVELVYENSRKTLLTTIYDKPAWKNYRKLYQRHWLTTEPGQEYKARADKRAKENPHRMAALAQYKQKSRAQQKIA